AANEDAFWTKVRLPRAYFELLFVFVRMLGNAVLFAGIMWCIDIALGFFNLIMEAGTAVYYGALSGLIIGSMAPSDLQAYARYASAYVGRFMVVLFVLLALIIGFASGVWLQEPVRALLGI
ncbi:MAG TPA: hypothetical protein PKL83_06385, partial [bacterium]|nr:hypothetical protein [bacterium]